MSNLLGTNNFSAAAFVAVQSASSSSDSSVTVPATLDENGEFSIALTNADDYYLVSVTYQEDPEGQAAGYRIDENNSTHLKGRMNLGLEAEDKIVAVTYKPA